MEATNGVLSQASRVLGVSQHRIRKFIDATPDLCHLYGSPQAKAELEKRLSGDQPGAQMVPQAVLDEIVVRVEQENQQLKEGLECLGLSKSAQEMAMSLQRFHGKGFKNVSEILGSGLVRNAMNTLEILAKVEKAIMDTPDGPIDEVELQYRKLDREYHLRLMAEYRKTFNEVQDASMKQARIAMWRKQEQASKNKSKAGFAPLMAVQVQPGATVNISEKGKE